MGENVENITPFGEGRGMTRARFIATNMIAKAQEEFEDEDSPPESNSFPYQHLGDAEYDSDDPRSFGGLYYWDQGGDGKFRMWDWLRLGLFHLIRFVGFVGLVLANFFGFQSRFQWAVDLVEREEIKREEEALERVRARGFKTTTARD